MKRLALLIAALGAAALAVIVWWFFIDATDWSSFVGDGRHS